MNTTRRGIIGGMGGMAALAGLGAARAGQGAQQGATAAQDGTIEKKMAKGLASAGDTPEGVTVETIAEAEKLIGPSFTKAEREQLIRTIGGQIDEARARDSVTLGYDLPPATVFDPRLHPGQERIGGPEGVVLGARPPGNLPDKDEDIAFAPVTALSHWIRSGQITSTRLTEIYLDRLKRIGPGLECVVTLTEALARKQAARADAEIAAGRYRGPLHGIPWGAKDLLDTKGIRTSWGAMPFKGRVAETDAAVVRLLDEAGAVLVAKLTLGALAYGDIWYGGKTRNPWNPEEGSSGSSAGPGAATAAGLVGFSIGSETLGSIMAPSLRNGTAGLRPTFGRVPRNGAMALCWSLDKLGPMTRTVEDAVLVLSAINAADAGDPGSIAAPFGYDGGADITGATLGYDPKWFEDANSVEQEALAAAEKAGFALKEIATPDLPFDALLPVLYAEAAAQFEPVTRGDLDETMVWQDDEAWPNTMRRAHFLSAVDFIQGQRLRRLFMREMDALMGEVDALISPVRGPMLVITNYTGHPALCLRAGFLRRVTRTGFGDTDGRPAKEGETDHRVPHSIALWGRLFEDGALARIGKALEDRLNVWNERPPV